MCSDVKESSYWLRLYTSMYRDSLSLCGSLHNTINFDAKRCGVMDSFDI